MRHSRKILSVLLASVLALSMIPAALAAEGETPATEGETHITILCTSWRVRNRKKLRNTYKI